MTAARESWSGRTGFVLAAIGSAVGLGSIWKFPYEVGQNGGAAFLLFYVVGLVLVVVPLMLAEFALGRRARCDSVASIAALAVAHGASTKWSSAAGLGVVTGLLILSFYAVIGGWTLAYAVQIAIEGLPAPEAGAVQGRYDVLLSSPLRLVGYQALFLAIAAAVVVRGVRGGIEVACKVLMPILAFLMLGLALYGAAAGDPAAAFNFLMRIDQQKMTARAVLDALGLGFFSIGVGLGLMITYAAYAGAEIDLKRAAIAAVAFDTAISLLAGFAVFPVVFANGLDPAGGPGLVFVTLPLAFARMPFGGIVAWTFFVLLFISALASAISMLELGVATATRRRNWTRTRASLATVCLVFFLGLGSVLSFNYWSSWYPLAVIPAFATSTFFDLIDFFTSNVFLPIAGFGLALFAGWVVPQSLLAEELGLARVAATRMRFILRYVVPAAIVSAALAPLWL